MTTVPYAFDDAARAIRILDPDLPAPWINYLSNGRLSAFVSQCAGGPLWWKTPISYRITRYRSWTSPDDGPGFWTYVRNADGTVWSPSFRPCRTPLDDWEARHEPGFSRFRGRKGGLEAEQTLFVAHDADALVWEVRVANRGAAAAETDVFAYADFSLFGYEAEATWGYYVRHQLRSFFDEAARAVVYHFHSDGQPNPAEAPLAWLAADAPLASWGGDRQAFLGPGGDERRPDGVARRDCGGVGACGGEACGALHVALRLAPGEARTVRFFLGVTPGGLLDTADALRRTAAALGVLRAPGWAEAQAAKVRAWWEERFGALRAEIPADPDFSRQVSTWDAVNCVATGRFSRSISQFASGIRGYGFRDTTQDMLALAPRDPAWALAELRRLLAHQFEDGHTVHWYFPHDGRDPGTGGQSDDPLWLPLLAYAIAAETGDLRFLDEPVPFLADDRRGPGRPATVWEHLLAAADFTAAHLGAHGLPLMLDGDWNDCVRRLCRRPGAESVMVAEQYALALDRLAGLAAARGDEAAAADMRARRDAQRDAVATSCWDGAWWVRAFDGDGAAIGTRAAAHGRLWLNAQTWAVLAGCGDEGRRRAAMDAVAERLDTGFGVKKLDPSFPSWPSAPDAFSGYNPGAGENGAVFCHAHAWAVIAEALLGRPERAWKYWRDLLPHRALRRAGLARYQLEPYAWPSSVLGPENGCAGRATLTHVTGTAAWMDIAATQYLLGIRPELAGLRLAPCLPADVPGFRAARRWRGARIEIDAARAPGAAGTRVLSATADGAPLSLDPDGTALLPPAAVPAGGVLRVRLELG